MKAKHSNALVPIVVEEKKLPEKLKKFQWVKGGASPNPHGRPRNDACITPLIRKKLWQRKHGDPKGRTYAAIIVDSLCARAANGELQAIKEILDRVDGKVGGSSGIGGGDLTINLGLIQAKEIFKE